MLWSCLTVTLRSTTKYVPTVNERSLTLYTAAMHLTFILRWNCLQCMYYSLNLLDLNDFELTNITLSHMRYQVKSGYLLTLVTSWKIWWLIFNNYIYINMSQTLKVVSRLEIVSFWVQLAWPAWHGLHQMLMPTNHFVSWHTVCWFTLAPVSVKLRARNVLPPTASNELGMYFPSSNIWNFPPTMKCSIFWICCSELVST